MESLEDLITNRKFEEYLPGLRSRFEANGLAFEMSYSGPEGGSTLRTRLEGNDRLSEVCVWESGHLNLDICEMSKNIDPIEHFHWEIRSSKSFHDALAAAFLFASRSGDHLSLIKRIENI